MGWCIGTKTCWKLVDDNSGEIICRSIICSAIEPVTANLLVDLLEPLPKPVVDTVEIGREPCYDLVALSYYDYAHATPK